MLGMDRKWTYRGLVPRFLVRMHFVIDVGPHGSGAAKLTVHIVFAGGVVEEGHVGCWAGLLCFALLLIAVVVDDDDDWSGEMRAAWGFV